MKGIIESLVVKIGRLFEAGASCCHSAAELRNEGKYLFLIDRILSINPFLILSTVVILHICYEFQIS